MELTQKIGIVLLGWLICTFILSKFADDSSGDWAIPFWSSLFALSIWLII